MSLPAFRQDLTRAVSLTVATSGTNATIVLPADVADAITGQKQDIYWRLVITGAITAVRFGASAAVLATDVNLPATFADDVPKKYPAGTYNFITASSAGTASFIACYPTF